MIYNRSIANADDFEFIIDDGVAVPRDSIPGEDMSYAPGCAGWGAIFELATIPGHHV